MHDAAWSRCLHGELRVCHQKRNEALDAQPGSTQGDRVPASKMGQSREDSAIPAQIHRLQLIQNSLARAVTRTPRHHHITPVLKSLHWLKIPERIHFKVLSLAYNS